MLSQEPQLAPAPLLACYLARFRRFFAAVIDYTQQGDKAGMLLGGHLADALHNVPTLLWHCDAADWFNPVDMEAHIQDFAEMLMEKDAPERIVANSRRILSAEYGAQELGLRPDLADADIAPLPEMRLYLSRLRDACLMMRFMRNCGSHPSSPWNGLEQSWALKAERAEAQAAFNQATALALLPVPAALLQWKRFDEPAFHNGVAAAACLLPEADRAEWVAYYTTNNSLPTDERV